MLCKPKENVPEMMDRELLVKSINVVYAEATYSYEIIIQNKDTLILIQREVVL